MKLPTFKGAPTISCPMDAPTGCVGFVRDEEGSAIMVTLKRLIGETHAIVEHLALGTELRVRREGFRIQVIRA